MFKVLLTNLSTVRRKELDVKTLMTCGELLTYCNKIPKDIIVDTTIHSLGRMIEITLVSFNFTRNKNEIRYVVSCIKRNIIPVLRYVIDLLKKEQGSDGVKLEIFYEKSKNALINNHQCH